VKIIKALLVNTTWDVLQKGNGKGEAAMVVPTSSDHHELNEIVGPLSAYTLMGANSLRCKKILSQHHPFMSFLPSYFLPCKEHLWMILIESIIVIV